MEGPFVLNRKDFHHYYQCKEYVKALHACDQVIIEKENMDQTNFEAQKIKAACLVHMKQYEQALEIFSLLTLEKMKNVNDNILKNFQDVENLHLFHVKKENDLKEFLSCLQAQGEVFVMMNRFKEALDIFTKIMSWTPHHYEIVKKRAEMALQMEKFETVVKDMDSLLGKMYANHACEKYICCLKMKAFALFKWKRHEEALAIWQKLIDQSKYFLSKEDIITMYYHMALCHAFCNRYDQAKDHIDLALDLDEKNTFWWHVKAVFLLYLGTPHQALLCCEKALDHSKEHDAQFFTALCTRYLCKRVLDDVKGAETDKKLLETNPLYNNQKFERDHKWDANILMFKQRMI